MSLGSSTGKDIDSVYTSILERQKRLERDKAKEEARRVSKIEQVNAEAKARIDKLSLAAFSDIQHLCGQATAMTSEVSSQNSNTMFAWAPAIESGASSQGGSLAAPEHTSPILGLAAQSQAPLLHNEFDNIFEQPDHYPQASFLANTQDTTLYLPTEYAGPGRDVQFHDSWTGTEPSAFRLCRQCNEHHVHSSDDPRKICERWKAMNQAYAMNLLGG